MTLRPPVRLRGFGRWQRGAIDGPVPPVRLAVSDWSGMAPDPAVEAPLTQTAIELEA